MMASLLATYQKGAITADHLAVECLHMIDPDDPSLILQDLPDEVLVRMTEFARQYRQGGMVTNYGILPAADQVEAARRWIEGEGSRHEAARRGEELHRATVPGRIHEQVMDAARRALDGPQ